MFRFFKLSFLFVCIAFIQSCGTLQNVATTNFEIIVPGRIKIPPEYKKAAIRYNNYNVSANPNFSYYFEDNEKINDTRNLDSIASEVYYQIFSQHLRNQQYFDTIFEIEPMDYSDIELNDSLVYLQISNIRNDDSVSSMTVNPDVYHFTEMINRFSDKESKKSKIKLINPWFGLYSSEEIKQIADSTGADLLLSFDYFSSTDGIYSPKYKTDIPGQDDFVFYYYRKATEVVKQLACWNFYDLKKQELLYSYRKIDTIKWVEPADNVKEAKKLLPPRKDAVLNAADMAGSRFAEFLVPHWLSVERMYYRSGHVEMKKTDELIKQNRWLEAAEIWKKNTKNKNKSIAAKSMFNMALACEMNSDLEAAIDWAVKSFYVFGSKNQEHAFNCQEYIRILAQRKLDIKKIESEPGNN